MENELTVVNVLDDCKTVIVANKKIHIKLGTECKLYKKSEMLYDPDTGENLGHAELYKGSGVVIQCDENFVYIACVKSKKFNPLEIIHQRMVYMANMRSLLEVKPKTFGEPYEIDKTRYEESAFVNPKKGDKVKFNMPDTPPSTPEA